MEKKNIDWSNIGFGYMRTDKRYVSNFKNGAWDEGTLTSDDQITISECAGVLQYAQTCFEGMKAYTTEDGHIVTFRPDLNAARMANSAARLEMPVFPEDRFVDLFNYNGTVNEFIMLFGADKIDWLQTDYAMLVVIILFLWKNLGYFMILFMAGLANIPKELLEVADVEGASEWYKFFAIKLRYLSPTVLFVTILSLINSFKVFREVYLLTGAYPYSSLYMLQHFMNNTFQSLDYQKLSAAAVVMAIVMVVLIALLFAAEDWFGKDVEG